METVLRMQKLPAFPGYSVSDDGRVWSEKPWRGTSGRWLRPSTDGGGYQCVDLCVDGTKHDVRIHRLVAFTFLGAPPVPGLEVRHLDGNPANNHVSNLKWGTAVENMADQVAHGTSNHGERNPAAKLTEADVLDIREQQGVSHVGMARRYGVSETAIRKIRTGATWGHVQEAA